MGQEEHIRVQGGDPDKGEGADSPRHQQQRNGGGGGLKEGGQD